MTMNLKEDLEELMGKAQQMRWNESAKTTRFWMEEEDEEQ